MLRCDPEFFLERKCKDVKYKTVYRLNKKFERVKFNILFCEMWKFSLIAKTFLK